MSSAPALEVGGYRLESVLGEGGMGTVYLARSSDGALCAVKVLPKRLVDEDPAFATRFRREIQYAEALDHPHVLELYEAGEAEDGTLFYAMQYVNGADLGVLLRRDGPLSLGKAVTILAQVADALDAAHEHGLVHRDVKPGNVIVAEDRGGPYAYLADFGLSKNPAQDSLALTRLGQLIGTLPYTAPEEILAQPRDHRVDVYSLGCVLYEALVGAPPFPRERDIDVLYAHIGDPRPRVTAARPGLPPAIDDVVARAMAISPADRYETCGAFLADAGALVRTEDAAAVRGAAAPDAPAAPPTGEGPAASAPAAVPRAAGGTHSALLLVVREGPAAGRELAVDDELVLGRLATLDGALAADQSISRRHARVARVADGTFAVEDEHSRNGTFVNGIRVSGPHPLRPGDELRIGSTLLRVGRAEPPPTGDPAPAGGRIVLRLELDVDNGELTVAIENGATARIVRRDDGWALESP